MDRKEKLEIQAAFNKYKDMIGPGLKESVAFLSYTNLVLKNIHGGNKEESFGRFDNAFMMVQRYLHNKSQIIITELVYLNELPELKQCDILDDFLNLAEALEKDVLFPIFIFGDRQEKLFRDKGFVDSKLKANPGEKLLIKRWNK